MNIPSVFFHSTLCFPQDIPSSLPCIFLRIFLPLCLVFSSGYSFHSALYFPQDIPSTLPCIFLRIFLPLYLVFSLGYSFHSDLRMLGKSWPFVADIISHPQGVVDLMILDKQVNKLLQSSDTKIQENRARLPSHPLLETTPTGSGFPEHLVLMTSKMSVTDEVNSGEYKKCSSGLSLLVERCLGKPLDKSQQLSDWERRPLRDEQMKYAGWLTGALCWRFLV